MTQIAQSPRFVPTTLPATQDSSAAYERVLPRMTTLADANLLTISRDNHAIAGVVLRALAAIKAQRPLFEKHFKAFDFDQIDCLEDFANAARQAQSAYGVSINTTDELVVLMPRAVQLRELLVLDATGLIKRGVLAEKLLKELRGANGYQNVAADLLLLVNYFKAAWDKCSERISVQDRDEAQALGDHLFYLIHQREKAETRQQDAGLRRQQSYTLLVNAYEYVRVALAYVFFVEKTGSVDEVAPSLFTFKKGAKKDGAADEETDEAAPVEGEEIEKAEGAQGDTPAPAPVTQEETGFVPAGTNIPAGLRNPFPGLSPSLEGLCPSPRLAEPDRGPTPSIGAPAPSALALSISRSPRRIPAMPSPTLHLGASSALKAGGPLSSFLLPAHHLVTHGVVVGMTGSGKTGALTVLCEEALRSGVPVLMIDVKGDLPNLLLSFPTTDAAAFLPWSAGVMGPHDDRPIDAVAAELASERAKQLGSWGIGAPELTKLHAGTDVRVLTPGSTAGEPIHLLSSLERRSPRWDSDPESAQASLSAAVSLVLRLVARDPNPASSRDHVLLSVLAERRLRAGGDANLAALLDDLAEPPIESVGALTVDAFLPKAERQKLASALNNLLASPTFAAWRTGQTLDVGAWLTPSNDGTGRTPAVIVSVAHLDDAERNLVLGVILEEVLAWTRQLAGTSRLRALVVFDEVYGYLPPHPHNPPTKRPLVALLKQARAFGVGVVVATQNPMDLDYRALGNAGVWAIGRLQTDADRERVVDGLGMSAGRGPKSAQHPDSVLQKLPPRWFLVRNVHEKGDGISLLHPRWAMSFLRGPMTRVELQRALKDRQSGTMGGGT